MLARSFFYRVSTMTELFPHQFGRYLLLERIAVGGMAELFKGAITGMEGFQKIVAIKRILPHLTDQEELVQAFVDEAKLAALLNHPSIVQIYDFGCIEKGYFIAMEYLSGKDLSRIPMRAKERNLPMALESALYVTCRICEGLDYAHHLKDPQGSPLQIIHRDISPPNVLVTYEGEVKIVDFGVAKAAGMNTKTREGVIKGKVCYMSPEQASGMDIDHRSDLFSTGILLYEMVTGQRVFTGDSLQTLLRVREAEFQPAENIVSGLPPDLYHILHRALAKGAAMRYQTAAEMLDDLEELLHRNGMRPSSRTLSLYMRDLFTDEITSEVETPWPAPLPFTNETEALGYFPRKTQIQTAPISTEWMKTKQQPLLLRHILLALFTLGIVIAGFFTLSFTQEPMATLYHRLSPSLALQAPSPSFPHGAPQETTRPFYAGEGRVESETKTSPHVPPELDSALAALRDGRFEIASDLFQGLFSSMPDLQEEIRPLYARSLEGWALSRKQKDPVKAVELLERAQQLDSSNLRARFELACLYTASRQYEKAIQTYNVMADKNPPIPEAVFNLAYLHAMKKDYPRAETLYRRLVDLSPPYLDEVFFNLALIQEKQGKKAHCLENLKKALAFNPSNGAAKSYLRKMRGGKS
jgi:serine/threonine protein kinase